MNADEIYKKYVAPPEPPVVEQDPFPNEDKNKWKFHESYKNLNDQIYDWKSEFGPFKVTNPNTGFNSVMQGNSYIPDAPPAFDIKYIHVSVDRSSSFIPFVTIRVLYSVNGNWSGIATTQIRQDPLYQGPGINPELLDMATQRLINDISIEVRDRLIAKPLKEKLCAELDKLYRKRL